MSATDTKQLIVRAVERLQEEVPSLRNLTLVVRLELRSRGGDAPIWRVELPGPVVTKDAAGDARIDVTVSRPHFNELAQEGRLRNWAEAWDHGHVRVTGDDAVLKLLGSVLARQRQREGAAG